MDKAVERAIQCIWERYSEPLTLTDIAESALLSRFYFARLFKEETGLTPGRFLAAVRIHEAKRLIARTSMSITEISGAVGYNSLGSFTNYFTASVGVSPGRFRRLVRAGEIGFPSPQPGTGSGLGSVAGTISLPEGHGNARVYLGAFRTPIVQHPCVASVVVDVPGGRPCCYSLPGVPEGSWHLLAVAVADGVGPDARSRRTPLVGSHLSVTVVADGVTSAAMRLRPRRPTDPPVLLALPELEPPAAVAPDPGCAAATLRPAVDGRRRTADRRRAAVAAPARSHP
ncbi:helix-turn-helix domain-containing protein [Thermomonospora catenispora]|uniref:helix-turn-helix domain-containing protein n=1 Tax=Thermomonospora catenispora TaxID=2493090 RepID=UPI001121F5A0|nr:AraC family transcriptional regulator [Thermomonospora catenispora]TNY36132.1 AraC family transcriptional regulator [Thermomonospora catenispora]